MSVAAQSFDFPQWNGKNCWTFVKTYFQGLVEVLPEANLPGMAADTSFMGLCHNTALALFLMQGQQWLIFGWHSSFGWGNQSVFYFFSYNAGQYIFPSSRWQCCPMIFKCARLKIVNALLLLTLGIGQKPWYFRGRLWPRPIHTFSRDVTMGPFDFCLCNIKICWRAIDTHFKQIQIASVHSFIVCNKSVTLSRCPMLGLQLLSFSSRCILPSQLFITLDPRHRSKRSPGLITLVPIWPAIYGI